MNIDPPVFQERSVSYEIQLQGQISRRWIDWFGDMAILSEDPHHPSGISKVAIEVTDQAALLGVLQKLHNLGYQLETIRRLEKALMDKRSVKR